MDNNDTRRQTIINQALDELINTIGAAAIDSDYANPDREFICRYTIANANDPRTLDMWDAYAEQTNLTN